MKKTYLILMLALISASLFAQTKPINPEEEAIKKVIQTAYVEGLQNEGDIDKIDSGIHPGFNLLGIDKGDEMWKLSIADWKKSTVEKREKGQLPRTGDDMVSVQFKSIDITGTAAVAKIEFNVGKKLVYVDYISLYKFESGWKMVNKIYTKVGE
ncbi:MAG: nuclear transport factor 2 family protein [Bacteroidales bacterium]|nr:nuclear transport factor 2 family protein [Bacteroidales bacterium]MCF8458356.1 nuclear transport factor 2 family protein [Bacteroidales bacterium]